MGALALGHANSTLLVPAMGETTPPAPGQLHPPHMIEVGSRSILNQPLAVDMGAQSQGTIGDMPPLCEDWEGRHQGHHQHHQSARHHYSALGFAVDPDQRGPRLLPPPDGFATGPSPALYSRRPSPSPSAAPFEDRLRVSAPSYASRPPLHQLPTSSVGVVHGVARELPQAPSHRGREPWSFSFVAGSEAPLDPTAARPPQAPHLLHPSATLSRDQQPHLQAAELRCDAAASRRQPWPPPGLPPDPTPRPPLTSSIRTRQAPDRPPVPGMPNLLGAGRAQALSDIRFRLLLRQQPKAARACGFGDRDRRVIDPPPIVQLIIESSSMTEDEIHFYLRYESYVMNCSICDESGTRDASLIPDEYQHPCHPGRWTGAVGPGCPSGYPGSGAAKSTRDPALLRRGCRPPSPCSSLLVRLTLVMACLLPLRGTAVVQHQ